MFALPALAARILFEVLDSVLGAVDAGGRRGRVIGIMVRLPACYKRISTTTLPADQVQHPERVTARRTARQKIKFKSLAPQSHNATLPP